MLRAGAVLSPDFMGRNLIRDQTMAFVLSKGGYFPVFDFMRGAFSLAKKDAGLPKLAEVRRRECGPRVDGSRVPSDAA
jgi:hypothetical protein